MESGISKALRLKYDPVALLWSDEKPAVAIEFQGGKWGCVMSAFAQVSAQGKTAVFDRKTFGCIGGGVGLGFGNQYLNWNGGVDCFYGFLSTGNAYKENAAAIAEGIARTGRRGAAERFMQGERYVQSPDLARKFVEALPMIDIPATYVVFKPLKAIQEEETPVTIIALANADQLSAFVILANYGRGTSDNVIITSAAGCQSIGILPYRESMSDRSRAVIGLTDISARNYTKRTLGHELMSFAVPFDMWKEMEANVKESFLEKEAWLALNGEDRE